MVARLTQREDLYRMGKALVCHFCMELYEPVIAKFHFKVIYDCVGFLDSCVLSDAFLPWGGAALGWRDGCESR